MLGFVDFTVYENQVYLIIDEDVFYRWDVSNFNVPVKYWLENRNKYSFKLKYEHENVYILVYHGETQILCEQIEQKSIL